VTLRLGAAGGFEYRRDFITTDEEALLAEEIARVGHLDAVFSAGDSPSARSICGTTSAYVRSSGARTV
jgi:hypothetical protein